MFRMKKIITVAILIAAITQLSATTLEEQTKDALINSSNHELLGTFGKYDFKDAEGAFDWAFTMSSNGKSYQLKGVEPSEKDAFGWKPVDIAAPTPEWYMFSLDIDGNGKKSRFEWVLLSANLDSKAVYKLAGANDNGTFAYSKKIDIDYKVDGNSISTGVEGSFDTEEEIEETPKNVFDDIDADAIFEKESINLDSLAINGTIAIGQPYRYEKGSSSYNIKSLKIEDSQSRECKILLGDWKSKWGSNNGNLSKGMYESMGRGFITINGSTYNSLFYGYTLSMAGSLYGDVSLSLRFDSKYAAESFAEFAIICGEKVVQEDEPVDVKETVVEGLEDLPYTCSDSISNFNNKTIYSKSKSTSNLEHDCHFDILNGNEFTLTQKDSMNIEDLVIRSSGVIKLKSGEVREVEIIQNSKLGFIKHTVDSTKHGKGMCRQKFEPIPTMSISNFNDGSDNFIDFALAEDHRYSLTDNPCSDWLVEEFSIDDYDTFTITDEISFYEAGADRDDPSNYYQILEYSELK